MTTAVSRTYLPFTNSPVLGVRFMLFEPHRQNCSLPRTGSQEFSAQLSVTTLSPFLLPAASILAATEGQRSKDQQANPSKILYSNDLDIIFAKIPA